MKTFLLFFTALVIGLQWGCAQQSLVGKWELVYAEGGTTFREFLHTFPEPSGSWLVFKLDASYQGGHDSTGIENSGTWEVVESNILKLNVVSINGEANPLQIYAMNTFQNHRFKFEADTLVITTTMRDLYTINKYVKR